MRIASVNLENIDLVMDFFFLPRFIVPLRNSGFSSAHGVMLRVGIAALMFEY